MGVFLESACADLWIATLVSLARDDDRVVWHTARDDRKWALLLESTFSKEATLCVFCALFKKVDSRVWADFSQGLFFCHCERIENPRGNPLLRIFTFSLFVFPKDSRNCGGAVGALAFLWKVSDLGDRAFHKNANTAALLTQS